MKMIGHVSDWLSYAGGALIKVADSAVSTVDLIEIVRYMPSSKQCFDYLTPFRHVSLDLSWVTV